MQTEPRDYSHETQPFRSRTARLVVLGFGTLFLVLALIGVFLPLLPTTPFLLLAAACYARASARFYNGLLNNRTFGPLIREWRQYRSIPYRTKLIAIVVMLATLGTSALLVTDNPYLRTALLLIGVGQAAFLYRIPSRDRTATEKIARD